MPLDWADEKVKTKEWRVTGEGTPSISRDAAAQLLRLALERAELKVLRLRDEFGKDGSTWELLNGLAAAIRAEV